MVWPDHHEPHNLSVLRDFGWARDYARLVTSRIQSRRERWEPKHRHTDEWRFADARYFGKVEAPIDWLAKMVVAESRDDGTPPSSPEELRHVSAILDEARKQRGSILREIHRDQAEFRYPHQSHWRSALDRNEHFVEMVAVQQAVVYLRLQARGVLEENYASVLDRLGGRGVHIARDIQGLLSGGFPQAPERRRGKADAGGA
jgi:hypothetical protein